MSNTASVSLELRMIWIQVAISADNGFTKDICFNFAAESIYTKKCLKFYSLGCLSMSFIA